MVAIIAILAAILLPALSKARKRARQATCASNLKQINLALMMYSDDYNGYMPYHNPSYSDVWYPKLVKYMNNNYKIFDCPTTKSNFAIYIGGKLVSYLEYVINYRLTHPWAYNNPYPPVKIQRIRYPSDTVWLAEVIINPADPWSNAGFGWGASPGTSRWGFPHNNGANFAFVAGNVEWYPKQTALNYANDPSSGKLRTVPY